MEFVTRTEKGGRITADGENFISHAYEDKETLPIIRKALLSYGPFIGLISNLVFSKDTINRAEIKFGYPTTNETVTHNGRLIRLSTGSEEDTMTRTRSTLCIWAITGGFIFPEGFPAIKNKEKCHVELLPYIKSTKWNVNKFKVLVKQDFFAKKLYINNPLTYNSMTKSTKALRERHQDDVRNLTLKFEGIVKNRRFAIVYLLAKSAQENKKLNINKIATALKKYPDLFIVNPKNWENVLSTEFAIAPLSGIPFNFKNDYAEPLTLLNMDELTKDAPTTLTNILNQIYGEIVK